MTRKTVHHIDKPELLDEMVRFHELKRKNPEWSNGRCMSRRLTEMLMLLVDKMATHRRWRRYTDGYIEEMKADALLRLVQVADRFNPEKSSNAFGYFSMIVWRTFKGRVDIENDLNEFVQSEMMKAKDDYNPSWNKQAQADIDKYGDSND